MVTNKMADYIHLRSYFPNYLSRDSIFTKMSQLGAPWPQEVGQDMDDAYFTMYSGIKNPSEFVLLHLNPDSDPPTANSLTIARILYGMYSETWKRLWEAYKLKYTPIDNYNIEETVNKTTKDDRTIDKDVVRTDESTDTTTTQYGQTVESTANGKSYVHGFNSDSAVPTGEQNDVSTEQNGGTDTVTSTSSATGTNKDTTVDAATGSEDTSLIRKGNVGQTSYQELLRQEFELWRWNFFTRVFEDTDKYLVLSVYSNYPDCYAHLINRFSQLN